MGLETIICVDDERIVLNGLQSQLRRHFGSDFIIELAESGEEALDQINELIHTGNEIAVVISDQLMPGIKGHELLKEIHTITPNTYTILLTGQSDIDAVQYAVNHANLYRYISKPWEGNDLIMTVKEAIKGFYQNKQLVQQNILLERHNKELEKLVEERTEEIRKVNADLNKAYSEIRRHNEKIISSITYAKRIQNAILPEEDKVVKVVKNCFVYYQPKDIVSGDFYWFSETSDGWFFAVGDCTGHGVPGAFMTLIANNLLNQIVKENKIYDPGSILQELDKRLLQTLQQQDQENLVNDGMDISIIRKSGSSFVGSSAKRPVLYTYNNELNIVKGSKFPIGSILIKEKKFDTFTLPCNPGDMIYLFTDGYVDQFSPENKKFMLRQFSELLGSIHQKDITIQKEELKKRFENWKQDQFQLDDVLVAGIRV